MRIIYKRYRRPRAGGKENKLPFPVPVRRGLICGTSPIFEGEQR